MFAGDGHSSSLIHGARNEYEGCLLLNQPRREAKAKALPEGLADHNSAGYPIWCCLSATGSMAGPCANPNIGVVTLGPSPRRFPPPWSVEELFRQHSAEAYSGGAGSSLGTLAKQACADWAKNEAAEFGGLRSLSWGRINPRV